MRRSLVGLLVGLTACTAAQEPAPTTPTIEPATTTSTTPAVTTSAPVSATSVVPTTTTTLAPLQSLAYEEVAALDFPIQMTPWIEGFAMIASKGGQVWVYDGSQLAQSFSLDISDQVRNEGERGLLSIAVHPTDTDRVFLHYSANDGDTTVSEFRWDNGSLVDEQVWLRLDQPAGNHNGGMLQFGPDGALYVGLGDGGGSNDRYGNGQDTGTLLGGLVRIDVDDENAEPELFQYGLRNPWRFWMADDLIYVADVGQNTYEEVSVVPFEEGINHGWPVTEGLHCFRPSSGCDTSGLTLPVIEVRHGDAGTCSITGGVVYRGDDIPEIRGHYFYSDYCGGYLRSFRYEGGDVVDETDWTDQVGVPGNVVSFGVDGDGEIYVLTTSAVLRLTAVR
ncbi:MAG: PQQ-dependent sugar dehydrogenase [Acidimicrobiia bacterium]|jgi:glucose/arabinose dehydrogenase